MMIYYHVYYDLFRAGQHRGALDNLEVPSILNRKHKDIYYMFGRVILIQLQVVIESHDI